MIAQGTPEWHALRIGKATGSRIADVVAETKTGPSASRANYMAELVAERLTGKRTEAFVNAAMQWGTDKEAEARHLYAFEKDAEVIEVAFVDHPTIPMSGASPDGLVGADGLVEFKCPNTATHIATLRGAPIDKKYMVQMQWQMACTGRTWCDFVSYDPRLPLEMAMHIRRVPRDDKQIADLETKVAAFLAELDQTVSELINNFKVAA